MYDPPHLLKSVRNMLHKHSFRFKDGMVAMWSHIKDFYQRDVAHWFRLAPRLLDKHVNLPPFSKMKVRLASQVLSHSVAAGLQLHTTFGKLTAKFNLICDCSLYSPYDEHGKVKNLCYPLTGLYFPLKHFFI